MQPSVKPVLFLVFIFSALSARAAAPKLIPLKSGGKVVATYMAEPNPLKPYVKELFTPSGVQVMLDSPPDHVHHHGLMFGIGAGTTDFWAEKPAEKFGKQVPRGNDAHQIGSGIDQTLDWIAPGGKKVLEEQRKIHVFGGGDGAPNLLTWDCALHPAEGAGPVKLFGSHYFGLGLRLIPDLNGMVKFVFPAGTVPGRIVRGEERLTTATWCAATGEVGGKPVTVAMWEDPRYDKPFRNYKQWFTMPVAFAYLSATLDLEVHPQMLQSWLIKRYGVAVFDGIADEAAIQKAIDTWMKQEMDFYSLDQGQLIRNRP